MSTERKMTLRNGPKKDYSKLVNGVNDTLVDIDGDGACVGTRKSKQKQTQDRTHEEHDGDESLNAQVSPASNSDDDKTEETDSVVEEETDEDEDSDDDLKIAEAKLQLLRKEQKILQKQAKRARILQETAELEKSLKSLRKSTSKSKKKSITAATLRTMDDVVDEVDRLMDQKMNIKSVDDSSSSEAESDVVSSSSGKVKKQVKQVKGRKTDVKTSGKSKNLLNSDCQFPQKWPHNFLNPHFVSSKEKNYEDLSMSEFCAGYLTILESESEEKKIHRVAHLKELMYLSSRFKWRNILDYHGACLLEIERGQLRWGDSFQMLQSTTLAGGLLFTNSRGGSNGGNQNRSIGGGRNEGVVFCKAYQQGVCPHTRDHQGQFYGQNRLLKHICGKCWQNSKTQVAHPETSEECPFKEEV